MLHCFTLEIILYVMSHLVYYLKALPHIMISSTISLTMPSSTMEFNKSSNGINPKKAQGPDEIPCRILKELDNQLTPALTAIFNQSLETGELPLVWTEAIVTPIYKKGDRNLPENYRPISLTCVCCKLLEHIICTHIRHHLDTQNILSKLQHGFRSRHSCVLQLTITMHDLLKHRDKRTQIDLAILDFSKAFDTVPHQRMLGKLSFYGIKGPLLNSSTG